MKSSCFILFVFLLYSNCYAQSLEESFTDGNFTLNPTWQGDDSLFQINTNQQLQSRATSAKDVFLSTASTTNQGEWRFWCRFAFSPSANNFMRVYLMSDSNNTKGNVNGYYVQLGGVTGSTDSITLYKQRGNSRIRIIGGRPSTVSKTNNIVRIKVMRDASGSWQLFSDTLGGTDYVSEGTGMDNEFTSSSFMGVFARFTSGNILNFFWDDFYAGPVQVDSTPPTLDSVKVISATQLRLVFNEGISVSSATTVSNFNINNGIGSPIMAQFERGRTDAVLLTLATPLTNNTFQLTANNIQDKASNTASPLVKSFTYFTQMVSPNDILISEFFPDPSPALGLPEQEFIELYNSTSKPIQLQGFSISDASSTAVFPNAIIEPDSFIIVCEVTHVPQFTAYGATVGLSSVPSLNNGSDLLTIKNIEGTSIHQLQYDATWYVDATKDDGGFTIEMDNPNQRCLGKQNFAASNNLQGGTPGRRNSRWSKSPDIQKPIVTKILVESAHTIVVLFSEKMDSISLINAIINISPNNSVATRQILGINSDTLRIQITNAIQPNGKNELRLIGATDCVGNRIDSTIAYSFTYFVPDEAKAFDILIHEIMPDPEPNIGLPQAEYIELYNRSSRIISLTNWTLSDAGSSAVLPQIVLLPDSFVVLTSTNSVSLFTSVSNVIGVAGFPSLGNDGDALVLRNAAGNIIHSVTYTSGWYKDNVKDDGGWSLEMVDVDNPCGGIDNWKASINSKGGTPSIKNSVRALNKDKSAPKLIRVYPNNATTLKLFFNEPMDSVSLMPLNRYFVNNQIGNAISVAFQSVSFDEVSVTLGNALTAKTVYRILVDSVTDCAGNAIGLDDYADIGLPETMDSFDIAINEILFNPRSNGSDFVEIINRSDKILDLKNLYLANTNQENSINDFFPIAADGYLIFPKQYLVLTESPGNVQSQYFTPQPKQLLQCQLPSFNDAEGTCVLIDILQKRYDQLNYDDKMHFALLDEKDGVSLERIDFNRPTSDKSNWTSASSTSGYGTPTYQNSQYAIAAGTGKLTATPEVFSPDGDGFNDVVNFSYILNEAGYSGNFFIYNAAGKQVKHLIRNEVLGTSGVFSWDGITENGGKAPIGIYICYFETFNLKGDVLKQKVTIVVAAKM